MFEYKDIEYLKDKLKTDFDKGLTTKEVIRRQNNSGKNILEEKKKKGAIRIFINQLKDPMIYILLAAITISAILKEISDSIIIGIVVLLNAMIGTFQEIKTEKALDALKKLSSHKCQVIRDGKRHIIDSSELVKGDVVCLESGNSIGADMRIIESINLSIDESSITGESHAVNKISNVIDENIRNLGDKRNLAYMSTLVVSGHGKGVVVATGMNTEIGKIAKILKEEDDLTPLQKRLLDLGKLLGLLTIGICIIMFILSLIKKNNVLEMLIQSISLAVAAIPEGLPAVVTIVLAIGVQRMIKVNAIVKKLPSVETLGSVSVVCSDKTGTLTENKLVCEGIYQNGEYRSNKDLIDEKLVLTIALCNNAYISDDEYIGSPIEVALLKLLKENRVNVEKNSRIREEEFNSSRKMMSTINKIDGKLFQFTKGAYDRLISKCRYIRVNGQNKLLDNNDRIKLDKEIDRHALMSRRILAFAYKENVSDIDEQNMVFLGFITFIDPPRKGVKESIEKFKNAGVKTVMITGDHVKTAYSIGKELGILDKENECISGEEIDRMSDNELDEIVEEKSVFARVSPQHKVRIVNAYKNNGKIVAMTGDGVNDAPSLKKADIGISMGVSGSDVAKEASDMILLDDNFVTIETAIEEGRTIYNNIKKSVLFLLSSNFAEVLVMLFAIILGLPLPLLAMHILIVNLITDSFPALALGADCKETDIMNEKPRSINETLFANGGVKNTISYGIMISFLTIFAFLLPSIRECLSLNVEINLNNIKSLLTNKDLLLESQTYSFVVLSISELFHSLTSRNMNKSFFRKDIFDNKYLNFSILGGVLLTGILIMIPRASKLLNFFVIRISTFLILIAISALIIIFHELSLNLFHVKRKRK